MPITQERFMNVVIGAKMTIQVHNEVKELIRQATLANMSEVNSVITNCTDVNAKTVLINLFNALRNVKDKFDELNDLDMLELHATVLAEEKHFKKAAARNKRSKYYQEQARRDAGMMQREPEAQLATPHIVLRSIPLSEPVKDFENTEAFKKFQRETHAKYWPESIANAELTPEQQTQVIIDAEREENKKIFGDISLDAAATRELELMREIKSLENKAIITNGETIILRPTSYDPTVVLRSSKPTDEELNATPFVNGEDIL